MRDKEYLSLFCNSIVSKDLYLWGAGDVLAKSMCFIRNIKGNIKGVIDSKADNLPKTLYGMPVKNINVLNTLDKDNTVFLITCIHVCEIEEELKKMKFKNVFHVFRLIDENSFFFHPPFKNKDLEQISTLGKLLEDVKSKEILDKLVLLRNGKSCDYRIIYDENQYFCKDIWRLGNKEVFVDAGAYNGDTIMGFKKVVNNKYDQIYAFEPDQVNFEKLKGYSSTEKNILIYPYAVWKSDKTLFFDNGDKASSSINKDGVLTVEARALDSIIKGKITFIKMDVEGAELEALKGAKNMICQYKPKMAICLYHKADDLWKIPFYIKSLVPEYKFYLRHHHKAWFETVLYAVTDK